ncbi:hypothetical protein BB560_000114 [Smittium megazygosporum]|uniref:Uncharacterized protein n=1 Tax=Smittium megazygosporum TaxID=133381 RepID=A0A2T9ZL73_9FUNG|nr:hypothetical protein BB560_000114 [Smittium megazygosporum]
MSLQGYAPTIELLECTNLLSRKSTDDEKAAGLMVLPHILSKEADEKAYIYTFQKMDWRFIKRLLLSGIKRLNEQGSNRSEIEKGTQSTDESSLALDSLCSMLMSSSTEKVLELAPEWSTFVSKTLEHDVDGRLFDTVAGFLAHVSSLGMKSYIEKQESQDKSELLISLKKSYINVFSLAAEYISNHPLDENLLEKFTNCVSNIDESIFFNLPEDLNDKLLETLRKISQVYILVLKRKQSCSNTHISLGVKMATALLLKCEKLVLYETTNSTLSGFPISQYILLSIEFAKIETSIQLDVYSHQKGISDLNLEIFCGFVNLFIDRLSLNISQMIEDKKDNFVKSCDKFKLNVSELQKYTNSVVKNISQITDDLIRFLLEFFKSDNSPSKLKSGRGVFEVLSLFVNIFALSKDLDVDFSTLLELIQQFIGLYNTGDTFDSLDELLVEFTDSVNDPLEKNNQKSKLITKIRKSAEYKKLVSLLP